MSIPAVVRDVELIGQQLFDHLPVVDKEISLFIDRFEKNDRHREFDGIIRASHLLVEAAETNVEALFDAGKMHNLKQDVDSLTARITSLCKPVYGEEHDKYLAEVEKEQKQYLQLCQQEAQRKMRTSR